MSLSETEKQGEFYKQILDKRESYCFECVIRACYEERIQTLLNLKEANYRTYAELDKKINDFSEWLEARLQEHQEKPNFTISASECWIIQQKFDEVFFAVKASPSNNQQEKQGVREV